MTSASIVAFVAGSLGLLIAIGAIFHPRRSIATWCFVAGTAGFAGGSFLSGISLLESEPARIGYWQNMALALNAILQPIWICFSVTYSRGDARVSLRAWARIIAVTFLFPVAVLLFYHGQLIEAVVEDGETWLKYGLAAKFLNVAIIISTVLIVMNLERTFRSAVGTMQWRIKFLVLGLVLIFGARFYAHTQALLFSGHGPSLNGVESIGLLIGCLLIAVGYFRTGLAEIDVYPSRAVLHTSITVLLVGGYLFFVGILAQIVARAGGSATFQLQAFLVLVGMALLALLLLSEKLRQRMKRFISHHFKRPQYDFRDVWARFTASTSSAIDDAGLCAAAARLTSETFHVLSVSIWLADEDREHLSAAASTSRTVNPQEQISFPGEEFCAEKIRATFDLERASGAWAHLLRAICVSQFSEGGNRVGVSLGVGQRWLGLMVLGDRVNGAAYTIEELELLKCIADQIASSLLNLRLARELMLGKELEAFQTISAFFVHDLKNAASTLQLMLQNLPIHFDDPAFRADALRGIGETTNRINQIIERLSALREKLELRPSSVNLNSLLEEAIKVVDSTPGIEFEKELGEMPSLMADQEQLQSAVTNLLLNARDAVGSRGQIQVRTAARDGWATLSVRDNGCGMSPEFLRDSLFRPFKTTKKKGIGIGMFQTKLIVEAHRGSIRVKSDLGKGTTFQITLPLVANGK